MGAKKGADVLQITGSAVLEPYAALTKRVAGKWRGNTEYETEGREPNQKDPCIWEYRVTSPVPSTSANPRVVRQAAGRETS